MNRKDLIISLILGEISAWLIIILLKGLVPAETYLKFSGKILFGLPVIFPLLCGLALYIAYAISKKIAVVYQIAKFVLVGGFNTLFDWGVLSLAIYFFRKFWQIEASDILFVAFGLTIAFYSLFKSISFILSAANSYSLNKFWTFKQQSSEKVGKEFAQFFLVTICGFAINVGIASLVFKYVSPLAGLNQDQWAIASAVVATAISMVWNFLGYKFIVFGAKSNIPA